MSSQNNTQKIQTCLDFIDQRLETTSEQTIHIAEMIIAVQPIKDRAEKKGFLSRLWPF